MLKTTKTGGFVLFSILLIGILFWSIHLSSSLLSIFSPAGLANSGFDPAENNLSAQAKVQLSVIFPAQTPTLEATAFPTQEPTWTPLPAPLATATAVPTRTFSPEYQRFVKEVSNGDASVIRGVYVKDVLKLPVIQQPKGDWGFVGSNDEEATQFQSAAANGVTGILAHNYLSGRLFFNLKIGQEVDIAYGDGKTLRYQISDIDQFQKLEPENPYSRYIDLETEENLSSNEAFAKEYTGAHRVVFQTCIAKDGNASWGLIFVIAKPLKE